MQPLPGFPLYRCRRLLLCMLVSLPFVSPAQQPSGQPYPDSLLQLLHYQSNKAEKAEILFQLSQYWADLDSGRGVTYAREALKYIPHDPYHEGRGHYFLAGAFFEYDIPRAQQEYQQAIHRLEQRKSREAVLLLSKAWHNYGALEQRQGREKNFAAILLNKVVPLATQAGDTLRLGNYYLSLSTVFDNIFDYKRAATYALQAAAVFNRQQPGSEYLIACYTAAATSCLSLNDAAACKIYLDSAAGYVNRYPDSRLGPAYYRTTGRYYNHQRAWPQALSHLRQGILLAEKVNRPYDATTIKMELYQTYKAQGALDTARQILLDIYRRPYVREMPENMRLILRELASTDSALHRPQAAYDWLLQYSSLTDTLTERQTRQQISELEAKYNYAEKEKALLLVKAHAVRQKMLLWGIIFLLVPFCVVLIFLYRSLRSKALQAQQIAIAKALLYGEERERSRLARDLHDGLGGTLASISIRLSEVSGIPAGPLAPISRQLDLAVSELRRIAHNMAPEALFRLGLQAALQDLSETHSNSRTTVTLQTMDIRDDLPQQVQLMIYRIVQELLTNITKHATAGEVLIQCSQLDDMFYITAEDNGKGFSMAGIPAGKGIGIQNIRNRVAFLNGKMEIQSSPGKGTIINIELSCKPTTPSPSSL
ncbi:sensor histidine kinase [Chitinophaga oryzae]|uniref:Oxygen sensor histidine kinase NreB n=1 Tax=Chitinophaga oryzae TaxID=2725414 RepID=A0AAE7D783_9BACT|nr:sensor histidine kinase [Chitinophaga oryzae]QJB31454.1 sensor histidine kinase [Chitinophaga oryzae]